MTAADLLLQGIRKTYTGNADVAALDGVTLNVDPGEFFTLLGPSGCGKTTLLRIIGGFVSPTAGRVTVRGMDVTNLPPQKRPTAMVFQHYALFPHMTVFNNVAFGLKVRRLPKAVIAERVKSALAVVNLSPVEERYPHQLSGGQQQRIALARALVVEPPVLLMDEPLGALDAKLREEMQSELTAIQRRLKITTIYVTHDQEEAFNMSDRVAVMNQGRIAQVGGPDEIYRRPASAFVANFVGRSNMLHGVVQIGQGTMKTIEGQGFAAALPSEFASGAALVVIIRPEDVSLEEDPEADCYAEGIFERRRFTGGAYLYYIRLSSETMMMVESKRDVRMSASERVRMSWRSSRSIVLPASSDERTEGMRSRAGRAGKKPTDSGAS